MKKIAFVNLALGFGMLVSGCVSTWQTPDGESIRPTSYSTYQSSLARTVGKLRRLLRLDTYSPLPQICGGSDAEWFVSDEHRYGNEYLKEIKGYDVVVWRSQDEKSTALQQQNRLSVGKLMEAATQLESISSLEGVQKAVKVLAEGRPIDGLLLVESGDTCARADKLHRTSLAILSLGLEELFPSKGATASYRSYRATIFEVASGKPVWSVNIPNFDTLRNIRKPNRVGPEILFETLEQAVPYLLTQ